MSACIVSRLQILITRYNGITSEYSAYLSLNTSQLIDTRTLPSSYNIPKGCFPNLKMDSNVSSCGAYCIVATLFAKQYFPIKSPIKLHRFCPNEFNFTGEYLNIDKNHSIQEVIDTIYQVIGIIDEVSVSTYNISQQGYCSMIAMAYVYKVFGLNPRILISNNHTHEKIKSLFPQEIQLNSNSELQFPVEYVREASININNFVLPLMIHKPLDEMHYHLIAVNTNNEIYDPNNEGIDTGFRLNELYELPKENPEWWHWSGLALKI